MAQLGMLNMAHGAVLTFRRATSCVCKPDHIICLGPCRRWSGAPASGRGRARRSTASPSHIVGDALPLLRSRAFETSVFHRHHSASAPIAQRTSCSKLFGAYPLLQQPLVASDVVGRVPHPRPEHPRLIRLPALFDGAGGSCFSAAAPHRPRRPRHRAGCEAAHGSWACASAHVYALVLAMSGALAAISGIMVSSLTTLSPTMGAESMLSVHASASCRASTA